MNSGRTIWRAVSSSHPRGAGVKRRRDELVTSRSAFAGSALWRSLAPESSSLAKRPFDRVLEVCRDRYGHDRDLVAERPALLLGPHRDGDLRDERLVGQLAVALEVRADGAGDEATITSLTLTPSAFLTCLTSSARPSAARRSGAARPAPRRARAAGGCGAA